MRRFTLACAAALVCGSWAAGQQQQFAELGDIKLASGEVLRECRIGYRTFGRLDSGRANAILFPSWAGGTSEQLAPQFAPGKPLNLSRYYVIAVDALANGVSSSPSNSRAQPRMRFPRITIRDMVETEHRLLTAKLGISHVKAVMGISMGGMQTFQWMVSYPDFMDRAIAIAGSPRLAPYDLLHWQTQIDAIMNDAAWNGGEYTANPARVAEAEFGALLLTTPEHYNEHTTREQVLKQLRAAKAATGGSDANDRIRQCQAMMSVDVSEGFGGSLAAAARTVKARALVVTATTDHVVTPGPAREFARLLKADVLELDGNCGHLANSCQEALVGRSVTAFLAK
ncbi:MAG TPA: alpha/beta fold hydrolase [Bryobacteraceae bacterium]